MKTRVTKLLISLVLIFVLCGLALTCYGLIVKSRAKSLLKDISALKVGVSTDADVRRIEVEHAKLFVKRECKEGWCQTLFRVRNTWLAGLKLEPPAEFDALTTAQGGVVVAVHASLMRNMPIYPTFSASAGLVDEYERFPRPWSLACSSSYCFPQPIGKPYLNVVLDSNATPVQRERAWNFSFRCLIKPGSGCDLPCDYLPLAWQDWRDELRKSKWSQSDFDDRYPKNSRCRAD